MGSVSSKGIDRHFLTGTAEAPAPMMYRFGRTDPASARSATVAVRPLPAGRAAHLMSGQQEAVTGAEAVTALIAVHSVQCCGDLLPLRGTGMYPPGSRAGPQGGQYVRPDYHPLLIQGKYRKMMASTGDDRHGRTAR